MTRCVTVGTRLSVSFDVVWRKCQHLSHAVSRKGRERRVGLQCHRGEGTAYTYKCHRLFSSAALIRRFSGGHVRLSPVDIVCGGG